MECPIIDIDALSLLISKKRILNNVSLGVFEGEYVSIIGPNGAGKTSLLKCLMRIYTGYEGVIRIKGETIENVSQKALAKQISYVPQSIGRVFPFTVKEFVMMGRYPYLNPFTAVTGEDKLAVDSA
ncbi:ABC transporter ATP-binding protein, partial [candidate division KSB1 bacterium]|nr:ABC transporter ATP-binding protein [candidate division KSB1 bacterium]